MKLSQLISVAVASVVFHGVSLVAWAARYVPASEADSTGRVITVVFRMDDYSEAISSNMESEVLGGFGQYRLPVVFGVIPYLPGKGILADQPDSDQPLSATKADRLRPALEAGLLEIAQHGYSHRSIIGGGLTGNSEFSGLPSDVQRTKIIKGKTLLEGLFGRPILSFCPPFNRYDVNTVRVLASAGFVTLSAGGYCHADEVTPLRYLPGTCKIMQIPRAVEAARRERDSQPVIVVLFHPYDFIEEDALRGYMHYADLNAQLAWVSQQRDIRVLTLSQASKVVKDLGAKRYGAYYHCHALSRLLPETLLQRIYPQGPYRTVHCSRMWAITLLAWLAILLGTGFLMAFLVARATSSYPFFATRGCGWGMAALPFAGFVWLLLHPGFPGLLCVAISAGLVVGRFFHGAQQYPE
ncbi:MAG: DUF2334 domain-containing protein [bacterium]